MEIQIYPFFLKFFNNMSIVWREFEFFKNINCLSCRPREKNLKQIYIIIVSSEETNHLKFVANSMVGLSCKNIKLNNLNLFIKFEFPAKNVK